MPKVSVIIPVYGVEKYIERCARSLFEQTLDDIEYLFINDCTTDKSVEILNAVLDEYPNRKKQVIIHRMNKNSGQAAVRKWGMQNATGEYVIHCDSDDWLDIDLYELMYTKAVNLNADIVYSDFKTSDGKRETLISQGHYDDKISLLHSTLNEKNYWSLWNKLVKRSIYNTSDFIYPINNMGEDLAIFLQILILSETISPLNADSYYYSYQNTTSLTRTKSKESVIKRFEQACANLEIAESFAVNRGYESSIFLYLKNKERNILETCIDDKEMFHLWLNRFPSINCNLLFSSQISLKYKIHFLKILLTNLRFWF